MRLLLGFVKLPERRFTSRSVQSPAPEAHIFLLSAKLRKYLDVVSPRFLTTISSEDPGIRLGAVGLVDGVDQMRETTDPQPAHPDRAEPIGDDDIRLAELFAKTVQAREAHREALALAQRVKTISDSYLAFVRAERALSDPTD